MTSTLLIVSHFKPCHLACVEDTIDTDYRLEVLAFVLWRDVIGKLNRTYYMQFNEFFPFSFDGVN